jgi:hypothetical protein
MDVCLRTRVVSAKVIDMRRLCRRPDVRALVLVPLFVACVLTACGADATEADSTRPEATVTESEHAVIVYLKNTGLDEVFGLEEQLEVAITQAQAGEYDGNEVALDGSEAVLYAYGPDADALWEAMKPVITGASPDPGSYVVKRYGDASDTSTKEVRVDLGG